MDLKKSKKGAESQNWISDSMPYFILGSFVVGIVAIIFVLIVVKTGSEQARIYENADSYFIMQRFLKSEECFAYKNDNIVFQRVIDKGRFNENALDNCYKGKGYAFRLVLTSEDLVPVTIKTYNWKDNAKFARDVDRHVA